MRYVGSNVRDREGRSVTDGDRFCERAFSVRGVRATKIPLTMLSHEVGHVGRPDRSLDLPKVLDSCISANLSSSGTGVSASLVCLVRLFLTYDNSASSDDVLILK